MANYWIVAYTYNAYSGVGVFADMANFHNHEEALVFLTDLKQHGNVLTAMVISAGDEPEIDVRYEKWEA